MTAASNVSPMTAPRSGFNPAALAASLGQSAKSVPAETSNTPKATIYLGVGVLRDGVDINDENYVIDAAKDLINLPQMQGLDNMKPDDRRASTQEFADQQAERNDLLEDLIQQCMATLEPGETRILPLYVTVYRKKDEVVAAPRAARTSKSFF